MFVQLGNSSLVAPVLMREGAEVCKGDNAIHVSNETAASSPIVSDLEKTILVQLQELHGTELPKTLQRDSFDTHFANIAAAARFDEPTQDVWSKLKKNLTPTRTFEPAKPGTYAEINIIGFEPFYFFVVAINESEAHVVTITPITDNNCNSLLPDYRSHCFPKSVLFPARKSRYQHYGHIPNIEDISLF